MRTLTTIVETLKIASMVAGATIGIVNEGMDKVKANSRLCDAATKESFKDLLTSNAECTKELSRAMIEYPISLFTSDTKVKAKQDAFEEMMQEAKQEQEAKASEVKVEETVVTEQSTNTDTNTNEEVKPQA